MNTNKHKAISTAPPFNQSSIVFANFTIASEFEMHRSWKRHCPSDTVELRHRLMAEETEEYLEAAIAGDAVEIADALGDQLYILVWNHFEPWNGASD
jgi:hypothetical protein